MIASKEFNVFLVDYFTETYILNDMIIYVQKISMIGHNSMKLLYPSYSLSIQAHNNIFDTFEDIRGIIVTDGDAAGPQRQLYIDLSKKITQHRRRFISNFPHDYIK